MKSARFLAVLKERSTTHGMAPRGGAPKIHRIWGNMLQRCNNPKNPMWGAYGGRGITVCERWHRFENFFADMGHPPDGLTLERFNVDKGYSPENCGWVTRKAQAYNRRLDRHRPTSSDLMVSY